MRPMTEIKRSICDLRLLVRIGDMLGLSDISQTSSLASLTSPLQIGLSPEPFRHSGLEPVQRTMLANEF